MNQKNFEYLSNQLGYTGFGEALLPKLKEALEKGENEFTLGHHQDFGKDATAATLQFKKSDSSDLYFFNKYEFFLKKWNNDIPMQRSFYINANQQNITYKEAYNLMDGRAIHKELVNKDGEKYTAWLQLSFKALDKYGNFEMQQFHKQYGYDLNAALADKPIRELQQEGTRQQLIASLERGNRQQVTFESNGREVKAYIEAAPQYKSLNYYDMQHKRIDGTVVLKGLVPEKVIKSETTVKQNQEQSPADDLESPGKKRKGKRIS